LYCCFPATDPYIFQTQAVLDKNNRDLQLSDTLDIMLSENLSLRQQNAVGVVQDRRASTMPGN
jgi:hypothetical protein